MLEWRVGNREPRAWTVRRSEGSCRRVLRSGMLLVLALGLLAAAAGAGFAIGRWSNVRSVVQRAIADRLALEELAWRTADATLYASVLDPAMEPQARAQLETDFRRLAPRRIELAARSQQVVAGDRIRLRVRQTLPDGQVTEEVREYVRRGADWYRAR